VGVIVDRFLDPLQTFAAIALVVLAVVAAGLYVTGPYRGAVRLRSSVSADWFRDHRPWVAWALLAAAGLVLWFVDLGWIGVFAVLAVIAVAVGMLRAPPTEAPGPADETAAVPGS
jgi:hypothetical protein